METRYYQAGIDVTDIMTLSNPKPGYAFMSNERTTLPYDTKEFPVTSKSVSSYEEISKEINDAVDRFIDELIG